MSRLYEFEGTDEDEENVRELKVQGYKDWYNVNSYFKSLTDDCSKELFGDYKIAKKRI